MRGTDGVLERFGTQRDPMERGALAHLGVAPGLVLAKLDGETGLPCAQVVLRAAGPTSAAG
ncbi:hypothetical protein QTI66_00110 [Variovorax sp. J22R133]|uniref:hypothetical protein n=1 Tax=Variovorax brevis TaxID=3053503 RepID=UPI0025762DBF|nr:hypothetical protein [Variovorax sp. J22R133]MDM0110532.1 hypothetical protein [Variovorax sp. J22R133]